MVSVPHCCLVYAPKYIPLSCIIPKHNLFNLCPKVTQLVSDRHLKYTLTKEIGFLELLDGKAGKSLTMEEVKASICQVA